MAQSIQSNIKNLNVDMTKYSLFLGGMDVTNGALAQYDPLRTGYGRLFVVKKPKFLEVVLGTSSQKFKNFFHMLEFGFIAVDGIQNTTLETDTVTGGYAGRTLEIPTLSKDETNAITVRVYEFAGSPIREMIDLWITGIADPYTGLTHYHGGISATLDVKQSNHSAEMIYVVTDSTGRSDRIEYACLLCNMVPKTVKKDHFNYESGTHALVQYDIDFTATKYESVQINAIAKLLVSKQNILANYTYFQASQYGILNKDGELVQNGEAGKPTFDEISASRTSTITTNWPSAADGKTT